jgi:glycine dehydrogenase
MADFSPIPHEFPSRHIGPRPDDLDKMLTALGVESLAALVDATVPDSIRQTEPLAIGEGLSETEVLDELRRIGSSNRMCTSLIGLGYSGTITPAVIRRNLLENPAWYTAYTPYQPEISQGRLEALLNFQTMVGDLTGMELANSSMLDEPTAAAEAMTMLHRVNKTATSDVFVVDSCCHPQVIAVIETRAEPLGLEVQIADIQAELPPDLFGVFLAQFSTTGEIRDLAPVIAAAHDRGALVAVSTDLLALTLAESPGSVGADAVVGSAQRFGVPMGYGGPHAGFLATREEFKRSLPGRLVGVSVDAAGRSALRLALQTREQHIRREKATSNICTAQVLLAVIASMYAVWHGPTGLTAIARDVHDRARDLASRAERHGLTIRHGSFFDTVAVEIPDGADAVIQRALDKGINLRRHDAHTVVVAFDETSTATTVDLVGEAFGFEVATPISDAVRIPLALQRRTPFCTHEVFHSHQSETAMMRYLRRLSDRDIALDRSMIPLGSCTMKLNAAAEMEAISWPAFANIHPFAPLDQAEGYLRLIRELEADLVAITGYDAVSLQPNAGSQGELAGLLAIRAFHRSNGDFDRSVCLIPSSAHGTNAASAVMAGMRVQVVNTDDAGNVDLEDLEAKLAEHGENLAAIMVTYPSTHGVFEVGIRKLCERVHEHGGQVYLDGANLNAMVGVAQPGRFGADVSHLNLHKTFCIPHGGGGPGVGPVACGAHLAPFLPGHPGSTALGDAPPVSGAPFGSAGILPISWAYIKLMGGAGLTSATAYAIAAANYVAFRLDAHFPVLYRGANGFVAHECILDLRGITHDTGVTVDDVAKRLIDYGFHAPTMSFPVAGTLMVEPTESESLDELDRFCDAMIAIRAEIDAVVDGEWPLESSPLRMAPHTAADVTVDEWTLPYRREIGAWPTGRPRVDRYWPPVSRIDGAYGDKNLVCSCVPLDAYRDEG